MRGDLSETGLEAIFGELARSDATGALHLEGRTGPAKVFLRDGDVYYASSPAPRAQLGARLVGAGFIDDDELDQALAVQESGPTRTKLGAILVDQEMVRRDVIRVFVQEQILDAVFDLARWDQGAYEFFRGDAVAEDLPVQIPVGPLLMEVRRRLSEWADIRAVIPSLDAIPDFVPSGSTTQAALEPDEFTLLTSVDGRRSIRELAHDLGYSQFDAARLIYGLSLLGVIGVPNGQGEVDPTPEPEAAAGGPETDTEPEVSEPDAEPEAPEADTEPGAEEDVDVGRALEEALFGSPYEADETPEPDPVTETEAAGREYTIDEEPSQDLEEIAREAAQTAGDASDVEDEPREGAREETRHELPEEPVGADDLEPEIWSASIDAEEGEDVEDLEGVEARAEPQPASEPEPHVEPGGHLDASEADARQELMDLVGELQGDGRDGGSEPEPEGTPDTTEPAAATSEDPSEDLLEDLGTVAPPPQRSEPEPREEPERAERGDVSELLRELSRLAGGGPEPVAPSPDEPEDAGDTEASGDGSGPSGPEEDPEPPTPSDEDKDDDKRSTFRRLFGSR